MVLAQFSSALLAAILSTTFAKVPSVLNQNQNMMCTYIRGYKKGKKKTKLFTIAGHY